MRLGRVAEADDEGQGLWVSGRWELWEGVSRGMKACTHPLGHHVQNGLRGLRTAWGDQWQLVTQARVFVLTARTLTPIRGSSGKTSWRKPERA